MIGFFWKWLRRPAAPAGGMWDHITPDQLGQVPAGLCDCGALAWSSASPRPHAPEVCARWRKLVVTPEKARELRDWFEKGAS